MVMRNMIPVIMAGVLGIYGLIIAVILNQNIGTGSGYNYFQGYAHLASGLACGLSSLGAGMAIGIFAEALGLYGLIVAIILSTSGSS